MSKSKTYYAAFTDYRNNRVNVVRGRLDPAVSHKAVVNICVDTGKCLFPITVITQDMAQQMIEALSEFVNTDFEKKR